MRTDGHDPLHENDPLLITASLFYSTRQYFVKHSNMSSGYATYDLEFLVSGTVRPSVRNSCNKIYEVIVIKKTFILISQ